MVIYVIFITLLCSGITIPSLQESEKTPETKTALKMSQINDNNISIVPIKYSFKRQSIQYALLVLIYFTLLKLRRQKLNGQIHHLRNYR